MVKQILEQHRGKENAISAGVIGEYLGFAHDDTHVKARNLIKDCIQKYQLPVLSCSSGYYIVKTEKEYNEYIANLDSRIAGIEERKAFVTEYYKRDTKNEANN